MIKRAWTIEKQLQFKIAAKTSRDTLNSKSSHFIFFKNEISEQGIGECAPIYGLSPENEAELKNKIKEVIREINKGKDWKELNLAGFPSLEFALETAQIDLDMGGNRTLFPTNFTKGTEPISINGLIWMSPIRDMKAQLKEKVKEGFRCIKIKVGSADFKDEIDFLKYVRNEYGQDIGLRLDANGAFTAIEVIEKLKRLSDYSIHSIEQPIKPNQWEEMAKLCESNIIPIALDEELIARKEEDIEILLNLIKPAYVILKPTLLGGLSQAERWIKAAEKYSISWWATSALESNVGLNAIAQWVSQYKNPLYQGLGTGQLFTNNIQSPLYIKGEGLFINPDLNWDFSSIC